MTTLIGTSGYDYKWWKQEFNGFKPFYTGPKSKILQEYSQHFNFVELNASFYKIPTVKAVKNWHDKTPDNFKFTVKVNRSITQNKKLIAFDKLFPPFFDIIKHLKGKLAGFLIQLPPNFKNSKNKSKVDGLTPLERVVKAAEFTSNHYPEIDFYVEFRDPSWFCDEVYDALRYMWSVVFVSCGKLAKMTPGFSPSLGYSDAITVPGKIYFRNHGTWLHQEYCGGYSAEQFVQMLSLFQDTTIVAFDNTDSFDGQIPCPIPGKMLLSNQAIQDGKLIPQAIADAKKLKSLAGF